MFYTHALLMRLMVPATLIARCLACGLGSGHTIAPTMGSVYTMTSHKWRAALVTHVFEAAWSYWVRLGCVAHLGLPRSDRLHGRWA